MLPDFVRAARVSELSVNTDSPPLSPVLHVVQ